MINLIVTTWIDNNVKCYEIIKVIVLIFWQIICGAEFLYHAAINRCIFSHSRVTKIWYAFLISPMQAWYKANPFNLLYFVSLIIWYLINGHEYEAPPYVIFSTFLSLCPLSSWQWIRRLIMVPTLKMEAAGLSETSVTCARLHGVRSQQTAV
jgi:hypothetical protein